MTFAAIYARVNDIRFNSSSNQIARAKEYVNAAETEVWNAADWVFKRPAPANLAIVGGSRTPTMAADFGKAVRLYDDLGAQLSYLQPDEWERAYLPDTGTGRPCDYTVINRQVYVGPTPNASYTFKLAYKRRYAHLNNVAAVNAGVMSADTDTPLWDSEFHYLLVPLAIVCGARLENDPAPQAYQEQADRLLASMIAELSSGEDGEIVQWGASC